MGDWRGASTLAFSSTMNDRQANFDDGSISSSLRYRLVELARLPGGLRPDSEFDGNWISMDDRFDPAAQSEDDRQRNLMTSGFEWMIDWARRAGRPATRIQ